VQSFSNKCICAFWILDCTVLLCYNLANSLIFCLLSVYRKRLIFLAGRSKSSWYARAYLAAVLGAHVGVADQEHFLGHFLHFE
jgi:hypothetical protein